MNQQARTLLALRSAIIKGEFAPGERLAEIPVAEWLGVSRTPVRYALSVLEKEGLLAASQGGGYSVRAFTAKEIDDAVEVRGVLEGMAARLVAEHGLVRPIANALQDCLDRGDIVFEPEVAIRDALDIYSEINTLFHGLIVEASGNAALARALALNDAQPFSSASAVVAATTDANRRPLTYRHMQHHAIFEAIRSGQGARAEALMREHATAGMGVFGRIAPHAGRREELQVAGTTPASPTS